MEYTKRKENGFVGRIRAVLLSARGDKWGAQRVTTRRTWPALFAKQFHTFSTNCSAPTTASRVSLSRVSRPSSSSRSCGQLHRKGSNEMQMSEDFKLRMISFATCTVRNRPAYAHTSVGALERCTAIAVKVGNLPSRAPRLHRGTWTTQRSPEQERRHRASLRSHSTSCERRARAERRRACWRSPSSVTKAYAPWGPGPYPPHTIVSGQKTQIRPRSRHTRRLRQNSRRESAPVGDSPRRDLVRPSVVLVSLEKTDSAKPDHTRTKSCACVFPFERGWPLPGHCLGETAPWSSSRVWDRGLPFEKAHESCPHRAAGPSSSAPGAGSVSPCGSCHTRHHTLSRPQIARPGPAHPAHRNPRT
jgi:hypothetical protein